MVAVAGSEEGPDERNKQKKTTMILYCNYAGAALCGPQLCKNDKMRGHEFIDISVS